MNMYLFSETADSFKIWKDVTELVEMNVDVILFEHRKAVTRSQSTLKGK